MPKKRQKWSTTQRRRVEELRRQGLTIKEIAAQTHIPNGTIGGWVLKIPLSRTYSQFIENIYTGKKDAREVFTEYAANHSIPDRLKEQEALRIAKEKTPEKMELRHELLPNTDVTKDFDILGGIKALWKYLHKKESLVEKIAQLNKENHELRASNLEDAYALDALTNMVKEMNWITEQRKRVKERS